MHTRVISELLGQNPPKTTASPAPKIRSDYRKSVKCDCSESLMIFIRALISELSFYHHVATNPYPQNP